MRNLSAIIQEEQNKTLVKYGAFFAFSEELYNQHKVEGEIYLHVGAGLIAPMENVKDLVDEIKRIHKSGIKIDILENGKVEIIKRELRNHGCYYDGDLSRCMEFLEPYGFTIDEVISIYRAEYTNEIEHI